MLDILFDFNGTLLRLSGKSCVYCIATLVQYIVDCALAHNIKETEMKYVTA